MFLTDLFKRGNRDTLEVAGHGLINKPCPVCSHMDKSMTRSEDLSRITICCAFCSHEFDQN
jgi:hypothetical protein